MLVRRGLPAPRNEKGATPVGKEGEILGGLSYKDDTIDVSIPKRSILKQEDKEQNSKTEDVRWMMGGVIEREGKLRNLLRRREILSDFMMEGRQEI